MTDTTRFSTLKLHDMSSFTDSNNFEKIARPLEWYVHGILAEGHTAVIGGPNRSFKTAVALDLAISLGAGRPFLGEFSVPVRQRVVYVADATYTYSTYELAERICTAKGVTLNDDCQVLWSFDMPRFLDREYRTAFKHTIEEAEATVVIVDPLCLCTPCKKVVANAGNLNEIRPVLWEAAACCQEAGATPVFVHRTLKRLCSSGRESYPKELTDLDKRGIAFASQWLVVRDVYRSRAETFVPGVLSLEVGGGTRRSRCYRVTITGDGSEIAPQETDKAMKRNDPNAPIKRDSTWASSTALYLKAKERTLL